MPFYVKEEEKVPLVYHNQK